MHAELPRRQSPLIVHIHGMTLKCDSVGLVEFISLEGLTQPDIIANIVIVVSIIDDLRNGVHCTRRVRPNPCKTIKRNLKVIRAVVLPWIAIVDGFDVLGAKFDKMICSHGSSGEEIMEKLLSLDHQSGHLSLRWSFAFAFKKCDF